MSSDTLKEIIDAGHDFTAIKYYIVAIATVFFYDYLLTLADEIKFAWCGRKSWVFTLFLANRYLPIGYLLWAFIASFRPTFSQQLCDRTAFLSLLAFVGCTLLAQVILTLRIYAVTRKNHIITMGFGLITISQFTLGLYLIAKQGAQQALPIPLDAYRVCIFARHRPLEIGFTTISLVYDLLAFLLIVYLVVRSSIYQIQIPGLFRTVARDATHYFLIIFTSHLIFELTLLLGRPSIQLLPGIGNIVYLPVMITRLMLSLKKATALQGDAWSFGGPTINNTVGFVERRGSVTTRDEIRLDTFESSYGGARSQG